MSIKFNLFSHIKYYWWYINLHNQGYLNQLSNYMWEVFFEIDIINTNEN